MPQNFTTFLIINFLKKGSGNRLTPLLVDIIHFDLLHIVVSLTVLKRVCYKKVTGQCEALVGIGLDPLLIDKF